MNRPDSFHSIVFPQVISRLSLNVTFTAVSSLATLWLRALSAHPGQKGRIKVGVCISQSPSQPVDHSHTQSHHPHINTQRLQAVHVTYNLLLYIGSFTLEVLGLASESMHYLTFFSTLWTSGMALVYLLGA